VTSVYFILFGYNTGNIVCNKFTYKKRDDILKIPKKVLFSVTYIYTRVLFIALQ